MKLDERLPNETVKCVDGIMRHYKNCIGFCNNYIHKGFLTTRLLREHKCLEKNCTFLDAKTNHPYFLEKKKKKQRKQHINEIKKKNKDSEKEIIQFAKSLFNKNGDVVMCKHLYDSTFILVTHSLIFNDNENLSRKIYSKLKLHVYIKNISERQVQNISYTYLSLLPENMREKVRKYRKRR